MRDQSDVPYIVIERDGGGQIGSFVVGALLGAGLALLFAPRVGGRDPGRAARASPPAS
jgi:hypothetical protein